LSQQVPAFDPEIMFKHSRYWRKISLAVSLLTISTLSISCSTGTIDNSENPICNNVYLPNIPYSNAKLSEAQLYEEYQLVFVRGGAWLDELWRFTKEAGEQAAINSRKAPIDDLSQAIRKSGIQDEITAIAPQRFLETNIPPNIHPPLINVTQELSDSLIREAVSAAISKIDNYSSPQSLEADVEQLVRARIDSWQFPTDIPEIEATIKSLLNEQSTRIAREATSFAISYYCNQNVNP
jgi:hypothetical protein